MQIASHDLERELVEMHLTWYEIMNGENSFKTHQCLHYVEGKKITNKPNEEAM